MKFSILIPVYNVEKYIDECMQSVLQQTYQNFEVIIIDDGSTDSSGDICDRYAQQDQRLNVFHIKNNGLMHARRYALQYAVGDYIVFLDSDDYLELNALEILKETIEKYNCDCAIYGYQSVCEHKVLTVTCDSVVQVITDKKLNLRKCFFPLSYNAMWRKCVKRKVFSDFDYTPYYYIQLGEDIVQSFDIVHNSEKIVYLDRVLINYRANQESITNTIDCCKIKQVIDAHVFLCRELINSKLFDKHEIAIIYNIIADQFANSVIFIMKSSISCFEKKNQINSILHKSITEEIFNSIWHNANFRSKMIIYLGTHGHFFILKVMWHAWQLVKRALYGK